MKGLTRDMSILGKYIDHNLEDNNLEPNGYKIPITVQKNNDDGLKKAITISAILHPAVLGSVYLISLILLFFGISFNVFERPKPKVQDIEFVLVEKEDTPINKKTPYRSDINSRAGGHHDPTKKVSMPSPTPAATKKPSPAPQPPAKAQKPAPQQPVKKPVAQQPAPKPTPTQPKAEPVQQQAPAPKPQQAKPAPPTARPSIKPPSTPKPVAKPSSAFQVPVPPSGTKTGTYATGPISGSGTAAKGGASGSTSSSSTGKYTPAPSLAPTGGSSSGQKLATGGGGGTGGVGNPGPGNPNGRPGIDTIREPDFGPYMRELQRRIKMNWDPPKGNESKRVVLLFKIAKDGRLLSCSVYKSSGLPNADNAAINAVKLTAPFKPLPAEYKGQSIDIQFTFDYNVFGASGYQ